MIAFRKWGRFPDLEAVLSRFPVAVMCVGLMALMFMLGMDLGRDWEAGLIGGLILAAYLCVGIQLASESRGVRPGLPLKLAVAAVSIVLGAFYIPAAFLVFPAILAAIFALGNFAHVRRERHDASVWVFTQKLWTGAIFAFIGSVVFALGVLAITETVNTLFGVRMNALSERVIYPIGLAFLAPVYWMGTLPHPREVTTGADVELPEISFEARILAFLGTWILAPLVLVYALIILAFILRSLFTLTIPQGEVATLVAPFIGAGTLTWLMLEPKVLREGSFVRFYRRVWFPVMIVASLLLLFAIAIRVSDYGFTVERFSILTVGLASFVTSIWMTFRERDIRIPTAVAAFAALTIAFLAKPVSDVNQLGRLKTAMAAPASAESHTIVRDSANYLDNAKREDWLREIFRDAPGNTTFWLAVVRESGFTLEADIDPDADVFTRASFRMDGPIDLSGTSRLIAILSVSVSETACITPRTDFVTISDDVVCFALDGERMTIPFPGGVKSLLDRYAMRSNDRRYNLEATPASAPSIPFVRTSGEKGVMVFTELDLNGKGEELLGGYGQVLIFTE